MGSDWVHVIGKVKWTLSCHMYLEGHISNFQLHTYINAYTIGCLFQGLQISWMRSSRKLFSQIYICVFSSVRNPCHDRIFKNFWWNKFHRSYKIYKIHEICSPQKKAPYSIIYFKMSVTIKGTLLLSSM